MANSATGLPRLKFCIRLRNHALDGAEYGCLQPMSPSERLPEGQSMLLPDRLGSKPRKATSPIAMVPQ